MPDNTDNTNDAMNGTSPLPLYSFFIALKQNGFSVTPKQIEESNRIIAQFADKVKNDTELCNYLSPLFVQNEDEQKQFKEIFDLHFKEEEHDDGPESFWEKIKKHLRKHWWKYLLAAATILVIIKIITGSSHKQVPCPRYDFILGNKKEAQVRFTNFKVSTNEKLEVAALPGDGTDTLFNWNTNYDWGDHSPIDTVSSHSYKAEGNYTITAYVNVDCPNGQPYTDTVYGYTDVCNLNDSLTITADVPPNSVTVGQKIKLRAGLSNSKTGNEPDYITWADDEENGSRKNELDTFFVTEGMHTISCTAVYDSVNSPCTIRGSIDLFVSDPAKPAVSIDKTIEKAAPVNPQYRIKSFWFYLIGFLLLLSYFLYDVFKKLAATPDKPAVPAKGTKEKYDQLLSSFSSKKPPLELPFQNKNYLPVPQPGHNDLARQMRKRINDEATRLELSKTIQRSIIGGGLFQPVTVPRTLQSEYLLLIDESTRNNQQVKLFEYLAEILNKQNVHVEKYYYRDGLQLCYNVNEPGGISFEKLSEKYTRHVLLIFGNAYELLSPFYPVFNYDYLRILDRWQYKAVLTPVSFADWSSKEIKGLSPVLPVFPVDSEGLQLFIQTIFNDEEQNNIASLYQQQRSFYKAENIDFENVDELQAYCNKADLNIITSNGEKKNILFQWIAALAVYPKIRWEITLAVGKAILDKYGKTGELNYTNLLRIVRIKWMKDGQFPDYTRLDLLKKLDKDNEVIARETILSLLNEIPETEINSSHFAYEEKEIQRVINETNLYGYDPVKYAAYKDSKEIFEKLWKEKKIQDSPAKAYFKNGGKEWRTLFNKVGPDGEKINIGIEEYIEPENVNVRFRKFYQWGIILCPIIFSVSLLLFLSLTGLNFFNNRIPLLTYEVSSPAAIKFTYLNKTGNTKFDNGLLTIDTLKVNMVNNIRDTVSLTVDTSAKHISFTAGGQDVFDSSIIIDRDAYTITLGRQDTIPRHNVVRLFLTDKCYSSLARFKKIVTDTDSSLLIRDSIVKNDAVTAAKSCLNQISYGKNVAVNKVNEIIQSFKKNGTNLVINTSSYYPVGDNEIAVYYNKGPAKPVIYIQYNVQQSKQQVQQLQACLNRGIFNAPGIGYQPQANYSRNEIRYYNDSFKDSVSLLQSCLKSVYPNKVFYPVKLGISAIHARAEIWVYDSVAPIQKPLIYIQVSDDSLRASANGFKKELEGRGYTVNPVTLKSYPANSEIYYFDNKMTQEARKILQYYSKYYPALPLKAQLINSFGGISTPNAIVIWIKKFSPVVEVIDVATKEIGYKENPAGSNKTKYGQWFGKDGVSWSAIFISWVYAKAGTPLPAIDGKQGFQSYNAGLNYFRQNKLITDKPVAGDIVIFKTSSPVLQNAANQVNQNNSESYSGGIFAKWDNEKAGSYEIIQGNAGLDGSPQGDGVYKLVRKKDSYSTYFIHVNRKPSAVNPVRAN